MTSLSLPQTLSPNFEYSDSSYENISLADIKRLSYDFLNGTDLSYLLNNQQILQLNGVSNDYFGVECLLNSWLLRQAYLPKGKFCNATWDNIFCWPATPANTISVRTCEEAFLKTEPFYAPKIKGNAFRICSDNGKWLWGNWTNYTECADSFEDLGRKTLEEKELVAFTQNVVFFGSMLSLCFLLSAVLIFSYFKCLWCDRVAVHVHLMIALILRYTLLIIITEPFVMNRETSYRNFDIVCKLVVSVYLFATMTSINWMFIEGIYINGKLTTNVFDSRAPFKLYCLIGWVLPIVVILTYVCVMELRHPVKCWKGYSDMKELWIVLAPMLVALLTNFLFLVNILRVLLQTVQNRGGTQASETAQFRRAAKATAFLIPLLGVNNLLFVYNPGGNLHKYYVILNALFGSTQGIVVTIVYCFMSNDVRDAFRRVYGRFKSRQSTRRRTPLRVVWSRRGDSSRTTWDSLATTDASTANSPGRKSFVQISSTRPLIKHWATRNQRAAQQSFNSVKLNSVVMTSSRDGRDATCNIVVEENIQSV